MDAREHGRGRSKVAITYDAAADSFDLEPLGFWARHGRATIESLGLAAGAEVLDAGCGSGASAIPAAEAVGPNGRVVGVDLSDGLLDLARRKAQSRGLSNVAFRQADMSATGYPDTCFDAVVCVFALFFLPDMERQVAELWRMVRPGGQLAITTWGPDLFAPMSEPWWRSVAAERPDLHAASNPWDRIVRPRDLSALLRRGGVEDAHVTALEDRQALARPEDWWTIVLGSGYRWTVEQLGPDATARVRAANLRYIRDNGVTTLQTSALFARARKAERTKGSIRASAQVQDDTQESPPIASWYRWSRC